MRQFRDFWDGINGTNMHMLTVAPGEKEKAV